MRAYSTEDLIMGVFANSHLPQNRGHIKRTSAIPCSCEYLQHSASFPSVSETRSQWTLNVIIPVTLDGLHLTGPPIILPRTNSGHSTPNNCGIVTREPVLPVTLQYRIRRHNPCTDITQYVTHRDIRIATTHPRSFQRGFTFTYVGAPSQPSDYGVGSFERIPQYDEIPDLNMLYIQTHNQGNFMVDACNGLRSTTSTDVIPTSPVATSGPNDCSVFSAAETNMLPPLYPLTSPLLPALSSDVPGDGEPISSPPKVPSAPHSPIQYADAYTSAAPAWRYHISALEPVTIQEEAGNLFSPSLRSCLEPYRTMPSISAYGAMPPERRSEAPCSYAIEDSQGYRVSASRSQTSNRTASATASRTQSGLSSAAYAWPCKMCGIVIARRQDLIRHQNPFMKGHAQVGA
ncbi:hypothetical protein BC629DRAFT_528228 [Irpex lacteus]|nr:hypothetical protein BC629DRAFT_528228 [Irpex lacteus]